MMKEKVLFLDRDGTLIIEPPSDYQVDSLEKLEFYPGVFKWLGKIVEELDYQLVMITNQDGLGTESFPEETFWLAHNKMMTAFQNENIVFNEVLIDKSFPHENLDTRKPGTGMLQKYIYGAYDLKNSFVIGDRHSDIELAKNLGSKSIRLAESNDEQAELTTQSWKDIYLFLKGQQRSASIKRNTNETRIAIDLNLDGEGNYNINTGLPFFDHMLEQLSRHGNMDLQVEVSGDLQIDEHHTIEDVGLALGSAFLEALGSKKGIERYGFVLPMDDVLAQVAIDFGGRPWIVWEADFYREMIGDMPTEMFFHFFKSFSDNAKCNLNIKAEGINEHHKIEAIFKAFAKAIRMAVQQTNTYKLPTTKGVL